VRHKQKASVVWEDGTDHFLGMMRLQLLLRRHGARQPEQRPAPPLPRPFLPPRERQDTAEKCPRAPGEAGASRRKGCGIRAGTLRFKLADARRAVGAVMARGGCVAGPALDRWRASALRVLVLHAPRRPGSVHCGICRVGGDHVWVLASGCRMAGWETGTGRGCMRTTMTQKSNLRVMRERVTRRVTLLKRTQQRKRY